MSEIKAGKLQAGISVTPANNFVLDPSADDGTLILRDSSGTALATLASGGEADLYARGNILGTVSESSGVPTGAIIETGSNANGQYTKFADGIMICIGDTVDVTEVSTGITGLFTVNYGQASSTLPAVFIEAPKVVADLTTDGTSGTATYTVAGVEASGTTGTTASNTGRIRGGSNTLITDPYYKWIAIGRWY